MNDKITLRRAVSPRDIAQFWDEMDAMLLRDVVPNCDLDEPLTSEDVEYFRSTAYREGIEAICRRETNPGSRFSLSWTDRKWDLSSPCSMTRRTASAS